MSLKDLKTLQGGPW